MPRVEARLWRDADAVDQRAAAGKCGALLLQTNLPIKEISARCSLGNTADFYRLFGEEYGVAPRGYRRKPR